MILGTVHRQPPEVRPSSGVGSIDRRSFLVGGLAGAATLLLPVRALAAPTRALPMAETHEADVATAWFEQSLRLIRLYLYPVMPSTSGTIWDVLGMEQAVKAALAREGMKIAITDTDSADAIETIQGALGTSTLSLLISEKRSLKALPLNGVAPSAKTIADGSYPLFKSTYVVSAAKPSESTKEFLTFLRSTTGREILARSGHWVEQGNP